VEAPESCTSSLPSTPLAIRRPNFTLPQAAGEVTLISCKEAPSDVAIHDAKKGTKGGKKRHNQRP
jgi:hypothetical protein